ncbi:MAG: LacI family DNA-binding transcriptional regulator [Lachnospiraceae bacterium]|nr:LacI family DNA-binding transcriptional regulator [Lachnospiraceae bacterium]
MKDIAREMHVSINAVSLALNNKPGVSAKMRGEIFECAQRMGYLQGKAKFQNIYAGKRIGLFVTQKNFTSRFYSRVISGIEQEAIKENYSILTRFLDNPEQWRADIKRDFFRGILIIGVAEEEMMKENCILWHSSDSGGMRNVIPYNLIRW